MASAEMPLMLDAPMDVDMNVNVGNALNGMDQPMSTNFDLFGDPLRHSTASKQLLQRLDEMRSHGCCQGIAWSRQGTIASVSKDGRSIDLRFLRCHPDSATWDLSEPTACTSVFTSAIPGCPVTHLAWSPNSSPELAVIDSIGRVTILSFSISLNRPYLIRRWDADQGDDLHAVVGCYWLPPMPQSRQYHVTYGPAVREASNYKYENSFVPAFGPWHPYPTKSALVCVTANGLLKLFFHQNNGKIEEASLELDGVTLDDLVTHASLCSDRGTLIIALSTASRQIKVIRATIQWGLPQTDRQAPPTNTHPLNPSFGEKRIAVASWFQQEPDQIPADNAAAAAAAADNATAQLSHMKVLPPALEGSPSNGNQSLSPSLLLTVRSHTAAEHSPYHHDQQSIVDRWEILNEQQQSLHSAFDQIGSRIAPASPHPMSRLRRLHPIVVPKVIISIHTMELGQVICFAFSDGTFQYCDRLTMNEIYNEPNLDQISSPMQVGFEFSREPPSLQVAFSPTSCSFVRMCEDNEIRWSSLKYSGDVDSLAQDTTRYGAVVAALSVATSCAAIQQMNYDDILAIARPLTENNRLSYDWIMELAKMLKVTVDYSDEAHHDQLVRNNNLQLCLSILNHLGFRGQLQPRSFCGKFAMLGLNVRNIVILISLASNAPAQMRDKVNPLDEPEVVEALAGCTKWALDLLAWLSDCLLNLLDDEDFMAIVRDQKRFPEITAYLQSKNEVSLHLVLCSSTRGYLSAACRRLLHLDTLSQRAVMYYEQKANVQSGPDAGRARTPWPLYYAYRKMQRFTSKSLVRVSEFDKLLSILGQEIRVAYQNSLPGLSTQGRPQNAQQVSEGGASDPAVKRAREHCELNMVLASSPPPSFQEVLASFFDSHLKNYGAHVDRSKLFFADYSLLEVEDDPDSLAKKKAGGRHIDVFKRSELVHDAQGGGPARGSDTANGPESLEPAWRRCVRCASVMENVFAQRTGFTFVLAQQRRCSCGGSWGILPKGSLVS